MSITTLQRSVNRTIIGAGLHGLRLPLTAVEKLAKPEDPATWGPAVAFETFEVQTKKVLGTILRDGELVEQARLQEAKIEQLGEAARLEAEADERRRQADAELAQRREAAQHQREQAEERAEARQQAAERAKATKTRQAAKVADQREAAAEKAEELRERVLTARERAAKRTRIQAESSALEEKAEALDAAKGAQVLDTALQAKKAQRKA